MSQIKEHHHGEIEHGMHTEKTALNKAIERIERLHSALPVNTKENRRIKSCCNHSIEILKEFIVDEKQQLTNAYMAATLQFDNSSYIIYPKTPNQYIEETFG